MFSSIMQYYAVCFILARGGWYTLRDSARAVAGRAGWCRSPPAESRTADQFWANLVARVTSKHLAEMQWDLLQIV